MVLVGRFTGGAAAGATATGARSVVSTIYGIYAFKGAKDAGVGVAAKTPRAGAAPRIARGTLRRGDATRVAYLPGEVTRRSRPTYRCAVAIYSTAVKAL